MADDIQCTNTVSCHHMARHLEFHDRVYGPAGEEQKAQLDRIESKIGLLEATQRRWGAYVGAVGFIGVAAWNLASLYLTVAWR